jgi:hypothetical protein
MALTMRSTVYDRAAKCQTFMQPAALDTTPQPSKHGYLQCTVQAVRAKGANTTTPRQRTAACSRRLTRRLAEQASDAVDNCHCLQRLLTGGVATTAHTAWQTQPSLQLDNTQ